MSQAHLRRAASHVLNARGCRSIPAGAAAAAPGTIATDTGASPVEAGFFAHQGGWDEFLLVAAPLGVIGVLLWIANKRVSAKLEEATADDARPTDNS